MYKIEMKFISLLTLLFINTLGYSQLNDDWQSIFYQIEMVNIDRHIKDSILKYNKYYPISNSDQNIEYYSIELDTVSSTIRVEHGYESGQSGFQAFECKIIKTGKENDIVIYSEYSGANILATQNKLNVYNYNRRKKKLTADSYKEKLFRLSIRDFFEPSATDSVIINYELHASGFFDLNFANKDVIYLLIDFSLAKEKTESAYLLGNAIEFKWVDNHFQRIGPYFIE